MFQRKNSGFTLLELMISILIMGIALGMGVSFFASSSLSYENARALASLFSRARVDAMLSRRKVEVIFQGNRVFRGQDMGEKEFVLELAPELQLAFDGKALMMNSKERFTFSPLGHTQERWLLISDGREAFTIYVPSIGAPILRRGLFGLDELRVETE